MSWRFSIRQILSLTLFVTVTGLMVACGGGGGGGSSSGSATSTGSVSLLVTDVPTDQFCEINVTITRVVLIGNDGQITLYSNPAGKILNLLDLAHHSEVFSHTTGVPAGTYSKVRLDLSGDVELKPDGSCEPTPDSSQWIYAEVPSSKLDLNPQGDFTVPANGVLIVELDMDAKAFKLTQTGNGRWKVRPVAFVNVITDDGIGKLIRVSGTVENKMDGPDMRSFELCSTDVSWRDEDRNIDNDDPYRRCMTVFVADDTSVFDDQGDPTTFDDVNDGDQVTVIGRLAVSEMHDQSGDSLDYEKLVLNAEVIEVGTVGTYGRYTGIVRSLPADVEGEFDFEFEPPQGILQGTVVPVDLQQGTKLYSRTGDAIGIQDLQVGLSALVEGVLVIGTQNFIKSSVVWVDLDSDEMLYEGLLDTDSVDVADRTFNLMPADTSMTGDRTVRVTSDAVILLVMDDGDPETPLTNERITLEEMAGLGATYEAEVYGYEGTDGSIVSHRIILQEPEPVITPLL